MTVEKIIIYLQLILIRNIKKHRLKKGGKASSPQEILNYYS